MNRRILFFFLALLIAYGSPSIAGTIQLPKTGQTKCYNSTGIEIGCAGTGQDGEIRAGVAWPNTRFAINGDCVTDNMTGLMWAKNGDFTNGYMHWPAALDFSNTFSLCGYSDWRLPNVNELQSLFNAGSTNTSQWLVNQGFINVISDGYWSSTTSSYLVWDAWRVGLWAGIVKSFISRKKEDNYYAWPVRGGTIPAAPLWRTGQIYCHSYTATSTTQHIPCASTGQDGEFLIGETWPNPRYTANGDCVTDNLTGLTWARNADLNNGSSTWQGALDFATNLSLCGYEDWRLPNITELRSLIDYSKNQPSIMSGHPFSNVRFQGDITTVVYWSSTTNMSNPSSAFTLEFYLGEINYKIKSGSGKVWPVRSDIINPLGSSYYLPLIVK
jgi:hypothetical protein